MSDSDLSEKSSLPGTKRVEALADGIFAKKYVRIEQ